MAKEGVHLVGELVPYAMGWEKYDEEGMQELYAAMEAYNMVVKMPKNF